MMVPVPQFFVVIRIPFVKRIKIWMNAFEHAMFGVQLKNGFAAVGFKIPDGMVEVEEKMFVFQGSVF